MSAPSFSKTHKIGQKCIAELAAAGIPANIQNYAVWFTHLNGGNLELSAAISTIEDEGVGLSPDVCAKLYQEYIGSEANTQSVLKTSDRIQAVLEDATTMIGDAGKASHQYGSSLQNLSSNILGMPSEKLQAEVNKILSETNEMSAENARLATQLQQSCSEIAELKQSLEDAQRESLTDPLTSIGNRKFFELNLQRCTVDARSEQTPLSLLMIDIDHFKKFNDTYGHQLGDQVLMLVGRTLTQSTKGQDAVARYGGEEFAVIAPRTLAEDAVRLGDNIRSALASKKIVRKHSGEDLGTISLSIGVAQYRDHEPLEHFVDRADQALYYAKQSGRNRVAVEHELGSGLVQSA